MKKDIYDFYRERMEHDDHMHIEVRDGAGRIITELPEPPAWPEKFGAYLSDLKPEEPFFETTARPCEWCGYESKRPGWHGGVAWFPEDDAIHCIPTKRCRSRLTFRIGMLLGEVLNEKRDRSDTFLSALLPE